MENEDKKKYREWGKLGGRPKKNIARNKKITLALTEKEYEHIKRKSEQGKFRFVTEYCVTILLEKELPNYEQNITLSNYAHNFTLISNYMKMGIFNSEEKDRLLSEIGELVQAMKKSIKW